MTLYILLPLLNVVLYLFLAGRKGGKKLYLIITLASLALISSLRSSQIGADYPIYVKIFENIGNLINKYPMEKGYLYFNLIASLFTHSYVVFSLALNSVIFSILYFFIRKNVEEKYYFWTVFIFITNPYLYIQSTFNVVRQAISTCIVLLGINQLNNRKYIPFLLLTIIAAQFHSIGYIYALLAIVKLIKWNEKKFFIISAFSLIFNLFLSKSGLLYSIANLFGYGNYNGYKATEFNFWLFAIFIFAVTALLIVNYKKIKVSEKEQFFLDTYILSLALLPIFVTNDIMYRVYVGLVLVSLPGIAIVIRHCDQFFKTHTRILIKGAYIVYYGLLYGLFLWLVIKANNASYIPFKFFWQ